MCTRVFFGLGHFSFAMVIFTLAGSFPKRLSPWKWMYVLPAVVHLVLSASFFLLANASHAHIRSREIPKVLRIVVPLHHTGVALASFLALMTALYRFFGDRTKTPGVVSAVLINPFLFAAYNLAGPPATIDFLLGCRLRFRVEYMWLAPLSLAIFTALVELVSHEDVQFPHAIKFMTRSKATFASWMILFHIILSLIALIAVPISYISGIVDQWLKDRKEQKAMEEAAKQKQEMTF